MFKKKTLIGLHTKFYKLLRKWKINFLFFDLSIQIFYSNIIQIEQDLLMHENWDYLRFECLWNKKKKKSKICLQFYFIPIIYCAIPPSLINIWKKRFYEHPWPKSHFLFSPIILYHVTYYSLYTQNKIERYFLYFYLKRNECDMDIMIKDFLIFWKVYWS